MDTAGWGRTEDTTITYTYDANGAVETKVTIRTADSTVLESIEYVYNLQGRLTEILDTKDNPDGDPIAGYEYDPQGIRVTKIDYQNSKTTTYLIDPQNHTGYAQVLEEITAGVRTTYTIGNDVIAQHTSATGTQYLLYDGHGSTRQLTDPAGAIVTGQQFDYDAYGVMLGDAANAESTAATKMLYAGEQYDSAASMYYNRARYYNPLNGLFNRTDPYSGNPSDPQSLHKYLYCHANPVNGIDPSGLFLGMGGLQTFFVVALLVAVVAIAYLAYRVFMKYALRGDSIYIDFNKFDISSIELADGRMPDQELVKKHMLSKIQKVYGDAGITVAEKSEGSRIERTAPLLRFSSKSKTTKVDGVEVGQLGGERPGSTRPLVYLGTFALGKLQRLFATEEELATAMSFVAIHELGHSYKLSHCDSSDLNNYMRAAVISPGQGTGTNGEVTPNDLRGAFLRHYRFTQSQTTDIRKAAGVIDL